MLTRDERLREMWHRALAVRRRKAEEAAGEGPRAAVRGLDWPEDRGGSRGE